MSRKGQVPLPALLVLIVLIIGAVFVFGPFEFGGLTIYNFRSAYSDDLITFEDANTRCVELYQGGESTIAVNARMSSFPASSLKSIEAPLGEKDRDAQFLNGADCSLSYELKSSVAIDNVGVFDSIKTCSAFIPMPNVESGVLDSNGDFVNVRNFRCSLEDDDQVSCCSAFQEALDDKNQGLTAVNCQYKPVSVGNPDCPATYWISDSWVTRSKAGKVVLDEEINAWVCRDTNIVLPYTAYSNIVQGEDLLIRNMRSCAESVGVSNPRFTGEQGKFEGGVINPVLDDPDEDTSEFEEEEQNAPDQLEVIGDSPPPLLVAEESIFSKIWSFIRGLFGR